MITRTIRKPAKTCPRCGAQHTTTQPYCPRCNREYHRRYYHTRQAEKLVAEACALMTQSNQTLAAAQRHFAAVRRYR